jgi:predicted lipid-binding transport protein (Tim44 family)
MTTPKRRKKSTVARPTQTPVSVHINVDGGARNVSNNTQPGEQRNWGGILAGIAGIVAAAAALAPYIRI